MLHINAAGAAICYFFCCNYIDFQGRISLVELRA
jgi:hypothetical protein